MTLAQPTLLAQPLEVLVPRTTSSFRWRPFARFAARDLLICAACALAWLVDARGRAAETNGPGTWVIALAAGLLTVVVAFLCHEWGHLVGTWLSGGVAHAPLRLFSIFLFSFDVEKSDRRSFLWMSYGGYLASALALGTMLLAMPHGAPSSIIALAATSLGVLATFVLEIPTTVRVARGGPLPSGGVFSGEPPR